MTVKCKLVGHDWYKYEKNPEKDTNDGYARQCQSCGKWDW